MIHIALRSKRLRKLFTEVLDAQPPRERAALERRSIVVVDDPILLPGNVVPPLAALMSVSVRKTIYVIYLSRTKLPRKPEAFIKFAMAEQLDSVPRRVQRGK